MGIEENNKHMLLWLREVQNGNCFAHFTKRKKKKIARVVQNQVAIKKLTWGEF